jgi:trigger factor
MNITCNETEYCKILVQVEADQNEINEKRNEVITKFKSYKVPGFRKNKATPEAIKVHFKKEIQNALTQELADVAVQHTLFEKDIKPFGRPQFTQVKLDNNKFSCEFSLHKQPSFELKAYKDFEIPKPAVGISADELGAKMLQELRDRNGITTAYGEDDVVQMGDNVIIDYQAFKDGVAIEDFKNAGELVSVGKIDIPGFSENILGMKAGETREFELLFDAKVKPQYNNQILKFEVKLHMGSKVAPAGLDDDLAKAVGLDTLNVLMENVNTMAGNRVKELEKAQVVDQIAKRLVENHDFVVPTWISIAEAQINCKNNSKDWNTISDGEKDMFITSAENNIKLSLVLEKVREVELDAQLGQEELLKIAQANLQQHTKEPQKVFEQLYNNGQLGLFLNRIKDEYTLDFLSKNCKVIE